MEISTRYIALILIAGLGRIPLASRMGEEPSAIPSQNLLFAFQCSFHTLQDGSPFLELLCLLCLTLPYHRLLLYCALNYLRALL
jgi:hypothetical protein